MRIVTPDYFRTIGVPQLRAGISPTGTTAKRSAGVVIVNQHLASTTGQTIARWENRSRSTRANGSPLSALSATCSRMGWTKNRSTKCMAHSREAPEPAMSLLLRSSRRPRRNWRSRSPGSCMTSIRDAVITDVEPLMEVREQFAGATAHDGILPQHFCAGCVVHHGVGHQRDDGAVGGRTQT